MVQLLPYDYRGKEGREREVGKEDERREGRKEGERRKGG